MTRPPPRSTLTDTLFPDTTRFRSTGPSGGPPSPVVEEHSPGAGEPLREGDAGAGAEDSAVSVEDPTRATEPAEPVEEPSGALSEPEAEPGNASALRSDVGAGRAAPPPTTEPQEFGGDRGGGRPSSPFAEGG